MKQQKIHPQGIYAGLAPTILMMASRGPAIDAKRRTAVLLAEAADRNDSDRVGPFDLSDTVKA